VLKTLGLDRAAERLAAIDAELLGANRARIAEAQALLRQFGARGVPTFLLERQGRLRPCLPRLSARAARPGVSVDLERTDMKIRRTLHLGWVALAVAAAG